MPAGGKEGAAAGGPPAPPPAAEVGRTSAWPAALALLSGALEAVADNVYAALAAQRALELDPENGSYAGGRWAGGGAGRMHFPSETRRMVQVLTRILRGCQWLL